MQNLRNLFTKPPSTLYDSNFNTPLFFPPQEFALLPEGEASGKQTVSLAASLSAAVAGRARYFEELSQRRVLRLGVECDLRAARAKLETLLASVQPASQRSHPAKGNDGLSACRSEEKGKRGGQSWHVDNSEEATQEKARGEGEIRNPEHQQYARCRPVTSTVSLKKSEGFGAQARRGRTSTHEPKRREGIIRGKGAVVADSSANTSANERRFRGPKDTTPIPRESQQPFAKIRRSSSEDAKPTLEHTHNNREKKAGTANRRQMPMAPKEKHSKQGENTNDTINEHAGQDTAIVDQEGTSLAEGKLQEQDEALVAGRVEDIGDGEYQIGERCDVEAFAVEKSCGTTGEEAPRDGEMSGKMAMTAGSLKYPRSPRTSPRRPRSIPSPAVQLRTPSKSPRGRQTSVGGPISQSTTSRRRAEEVKTFPAVGDGSRPEETCDVSPDDTVEHRHRVLEATSNVSGEEGAIDEISADTTEILGQEKSADARDTAAEGDKTSKLKEVERRAKLGTKLPRESASRSLGKTTKIKPGLRATKVPPTRLGVTVKAQRVLAENAGKDAAGPTSERDLVVAVGRANEAQRSEGSEIEIPLGGSGAGSAACGGITTDTTFGEASADESGIARSNATDMEFRQAPTCKESSTQDEVLCSDAPRTTLTQDVQAVAGDRIGSSRSEEAGNRLTEVCGDRVDVASEPPDTGKDDGVDDLLPQDVVILEKALRVEVDRLRLEKAELEDTVAHLNVAAAQLYLVEYDQMKVCCGMDSSFRQAAGVQQSTSHCARLRRTYRKKKNHPRACFASTRGFPGRFLLQL